MRISDIPEFKDRSHLLKIDENKYVLDAAKEMALNNYGSIIVTSNGKLAGMFTERDILSKIVAQNKDYKKLKLKDVMTKNVKTAKYDDNISDSLRRMTHGKFRHLPIIDNKKKVVGIVSLGDLVAYSWPQLFNLLKMKTRSSFLTYTEIWMLVLFVLIYITIVMAIT